MINVSDCMHAAAAAAAAASCFQSFITYKVAVISCCVCRKYNVWKQRWSTAQSSCAPWREKHPLGRRLLTPT